MLQSLINNELKTRNGLNFIMKYAEIHSILSLTDAINNAIEYITTQVVCNHQPEVDFFVDIEGNDYEYETPSYYEHLINDAHYSHEEAERELVLASIRVYICTSAEPIISPAMPYADVLADIDDDSLPF